jgi:hypothetical protein
VASNRRSSILRVGVFVSVALIAMTLIPVPFTTHRADALLICNCNGSSYAANVSVSIYNTSLTQKVSSLSIGESAIAVVSVTAVTPLASGEPSTPTGTVEIDWGAADNAELCTATLGDKPLDNLCEFNYSKFCPTGDDALSSFPDGSQDEQCFNADSDTTTWGLETIGANYSGDDYFGPAYGDSTLSVSPISCDYDPNEADGTASNEGCTNAEPETNGVGPLQAPTQNDMPAPISVLSVGGADPSMGYEDPASSDVAAAFVTNGTDWKEYFVNTAGAGGSTPECLGGGTSNTCATNDAIPPADMANFISVGSPYFGQIDTANGDFYYLAYAERGYYNPADESNDADACIGIAFSTQQVSAYPSESAAQTGTGEPSGTTITFAPYIPSAVENSSSTGYESSAFYCSPLASVNDIDPQIQTIWNPVSSALEQWLVFSSQAPGDESIDAVPVNISVSTGGQPSWAPTTEPPQHLMYFGNPGCQSGVSGAIADPTPASDPECFNGFQYDTNLNGPALPGLPLTSGWEIENPAMIQVPSIQGDASNSNSFSCDPTGVDSEFGSDVQCFVLTASIGRWGPLPPSSSTTFGAWDYNTVEAPCTLQFTPGAVNAYPAWNCAVVSPWESASGDFDNATWLLGGGGGLSFADQCLSSGVTPDNSSGSPVFSGLCPGGDGVACPSVTNAEGGATYSCPPIFGIWETWVYDAATGLLHRQAYVGSFSD